MRMKRTKTIQIRVNEQEYKTITRKAKIKDMTISNFLRKTALNARIKDGGQYPL